VHKKQNVVIGTAVILLSLILVWYAFAQNDRDKTYSVRLESVPRNPIIFRSNMFTQPEADESVFSSPNPSLAGFVLAAENNFLQLFVNEKTLAIKVRNLTTGYLFSSTLDDFEEHNLNNIWVQFIESALSIDYINAKGTVVRESITTGSSLVDVRILKNGFVANTIFGNSRIEVELQVLLENADVIVSVPWESIVETPNAKITQMQLYPFFGATKEKQIPGYIFIPDGSGALIRYGQTSMSSPFRAAVYGENLGFGPNNVSNANPPYTATVPVFGMVHGVNKNGFLTVIEDGDDYAELFAYTAGLITEFNWASALFKYRYSFTRPTRADATRGPSVLMQQNEPNVFDITLRFCFLSGDNANYVGMALAYQKLLETTGILTPVSEPLPTMRFDFFGGEILPRPFINRYVGMTPIRDLPVHIDTLAEKYDINSLILVYRTFECGGSLASPGNFNIAGKLGNLSSTQSSIAELEKINVNIFFQRNYFHVFVSPSDFFTGTNLAKGINNQYISDGEIWGRTIRFTMPQIALEQANADVVRMARYGIKNLALDIPDAFSIFNDGYETNRDESRDFLQKAIDVFAHAGKVALYHPNSYLWSHTDYYLDIPMSSSRYLFTTDSVPFLQIVLSGYMGYYAPPVNFSANRSMDLLRMIDYGAFPSFLLTSRPTSLLKETFSNNIFTSEVDQLEDIIADHHGTIDAALSLVSGKRIVARDVLAPGVVRVMYENRVAIIVNYTSDVFEYNGVLVQAENFMVTGEPQNE